MGHYRTLAARPAENGTTSCRPVSARAPKASASPATMRSTRDTPVQGPAGTAHFAIQRHPTNAIPPRDQDPRERASAATTVPADQEEQEETSVQTQSEAGAAPRAVSPARVASRLGAGSPLPTPVASQARSFFGVDMGRVRVHTDSSAAESARDLRAQAFTVGADIAFAPGRYAPTNPEGQHLLFHELTHVVQQSRGLGPGIARAGIGAPGDAYEQEADRNADRFLAGERSDLSSCKGGRGTGGSAVQMYSGSAAATYAKAWALSTNPSYPRYPNDCTNFVSQAVLAGGWTMAGGSCSDRTSDSAWWYGSSTCWYPSVRSSYTWAGAQNFYNFTASSGRGAHAANILDLNIGDVLQMAFSGTHIGHSMVVTDKKDNNIFLSYHTSDHLDEPFYGTGGIYERNPSATYYGWKL